jgi:hypothetical protein
MKYRITIEEELPDKDKWDNKQYNVLLCQTVNELDVHDLAVYINTPLQYKQQSDREDLKVGFIES